MTHLSLNLLGPFQAALDGEPVNNFISDKVRALLVYLAVEAHKPHRRESLAGLLWTEQSELSARTNLRRALANLRQVIGDNRAEPPFLLITRQTIQFNRDSDYWLDVELFTGDNKMETTQDINLYRGNFLEGFSIDGSLAFEEWSLLTRERLDRQMGNALGAHASYHEQQADYQQALPYAWRLIELDPWQEAAHRQLMRLLVFTGQRNAALTQYENLRSILAKELDIEPEEETKQLFEKIRSGEAILLQQRGEHIGGIQREAQLFSESPYRGLSAFGEEDAHFFCGRDVFTDQLVETVNQLPLVTAVVGSSGCGKSSVVFAGLIPQMRVEPEWLITHFRPGGNPFKAEASALLTLLKPELSETDHLVESKSLAEALYSGKITFFDVLERIIEKYRSAERILIVIDQFEELFTLCPDPEIRSLFLDRLLEGLNPREVYRKPVVVLLLTIRADFMGHLLTHRALTDAIQDTFLLMGPMNRDELRVAIEKPAKFQGAAFEPGLVERILEDAGEKPGSLPLLEFALTLLWDRKTGGWLTHSGYESIGCVNGALTCYAEKVFYDLNSQEKERSQTIFIQLVQPGIGTEDARRMAYRTDLFEDEWMLVQHLADKRLVVTGRDPDGREIVEIAHEALIRQWDRLRAWVNEARSFRTWQEELRTIMRTWEASGFDEGGLLRGVPLSRSESWLAERGNELGEPEKDFIQQSVELRESRKRETKKRKRRTTMALACGLAIIILLVIFGFQNWTESARQTEVDYSIKIANSAMSANMKGEADQALALALEAVSIGNPPRESVHALSSIALGPGTRNILIGHQSPVQSLAINPDSRLALSGGCSRLTDVEVCSRGEIILWDLASGAELRRMVGHGNWVTELAFIPNSRSNFGMLTAVSGDPHGNFFLWDIEDGIIIRKFVDYRGISSIAISPDGKTMLSSSDGNTLIIWDLLSGMRVRTLDGHTRGVTSTAYSPDGKTILTGSMDNTLILWDANTGEKIHTLQGHQDSVIDMAYHPDGRTALSIGKDQALRQWDLLSGSQVNEKFTNRNPGLLEISPDGQIAVVTEDNIIHAWDIDLWQESWYVKGHPDAITALQFTSDGSLLLSGGIDGILRLWDARDFKELKRFNTGTDILTALDVSSDGKKILTGSLTGDASVWDVETGEKLHQLVGDGIPVSTGAVGISPDAEMGLVGTGFQYFGSDEKSLVLWDLENGKRIQSFEGHEFPLRSVAFSPTGQFILSGSQNNYENIGELFSWSVATGEQILSFYSTDDITSIILNPDGTLALTSSEYFGNVTLWDVDSGKMVSKIDGFTEKVLVADFGPDEKTAIAGFSDGSLIRLDLETGEIIRHYQGHESAIWALDVSPDARFVLSGDDDGKVILWDLATGEELFRLRGHTKAVQGVSFSPDGKTAFSAGRDGELIQWRIADLPFGNLVEWVKANRYVRDLTCGERDQYEVEPLCED